MADQKQNSGPYTIYGRRTEHEQEVRVGMAHDLGRAQKDADLMVDSGVWHQATVRDRTDQTVHVGRKEDRQDAGDGSDEPLPAA